MRVHFVNFFDNLRASLVHSLQTPFVETFAAKGDPMQPCHPFNVFFFLQPRGCFSPFPCTKAATHDRSKLKHLHPNGWSHCIFRIAFIISVYSEMGSLWQRAEKWCEMNLQGWAWNSIVKFWMHVGVPKTWFMPKPLGNYCWCGIMTYRLIACEPFGTCKQGYPTIFKACCPRFKTITSHFQKDLGPIIKMFYLGTI
jgi:hypothetical protein